MNVERTLLIERWLRNGDVVEVQDETKAETAKGGKS